VKGSALGALGPRVATTLVYPEFLAWCGRKLLIVAGGDRYTTRGKRLVVLSPPRPGYGQLWRSRDLSSDRSRSWISPACSPGGRSIAVSAGRNWFEPRFGAERRSIWVVGFDGSRRRLTWPGAATDELPRWSRDGRYILFVRTRLPRGGSAARGSLRLVDVRSGREIALPVSLSGGIGYYGHYGWSESTDWFR
jgi:dipeptidyl aminopeptidase/acylaminoacyl peptidase